MAQRLARVALRVEAEILVELVEPPAQEIFGSSGQRERKGDGVGNAVHREIAVRDVAGRRFLDERALERDVRILRDVEEIRRSQILVALRNARVDTCSLDHRLDLAVLEVLLIEDDIEREIGEFPLHLGHAAEENGFDAKVTISAENFRKAYEAEEPDVIAVDLAMPGGDGIELLRYLAERRSEAVVVIVSGFDSRVLEAAMRLGECLGLRMAGPLHKPMRVADLLTAIHSARPVPER